MALLCPNQDELVTQAAGRCCGIFWLGFTLAAYITSFSALEQGKYALLLNWSTQRIDPQVHVLPGLRFHGLGNMLLEFPSAFQTLYFSDVVKYDCSDPPAGGAYTPDCHELRKSPLYVRTRDGLEMKVSVAFQWRLNHTDLHDLYDNFGWDLYKDEFVRIASSSIVEACSFFHAKDYFSNRLNITKEMHAVLEAHFNRPQIGLKVEIRDVQLKEVDMPADYDEEIKTTQEMMQEVKVAEAEREEKRIQLEREVMVASEQYTMLVTQARGTAEKVRLGNVVFVEQLLNFQKKQAVMNARVLANFANATDPFGHLFEIMKLKAVREHNHKKLLLAV